jgi:hypothetical protein
MAALAAVTVGITVIDIDVANSAASEPRPSSVSQSR